MDKYLYWSRNWIKILWWSFIIKLGYKRSKDPIPQGVYCYKPDDEKNRKNKNNSVFFVEPCKYYKTLGNRYNGCSYLGIITDDMVFDDQCKMCDIKEQCREELDS